jgi:Ca2+-binding RTX toxin-like protein
MAINIINGTDENDILGQTTLGADQMTGKKGDDKFYVNNIADTIIENLNEGIDTVISSLNYILGNNLENLTLIGSTALNGTGNALNNSITGNTANNKLSGLDGNDILRGGAGNDILDGGNGNDIFNGHAGSDALIGGTGSDTYYADATDTITELAGQGTDRVISYIDYTLGNNVENLTLVGTTALIGTGNALNNTMLGNDAYNTLRGGVGDDMLNGGAGNDTLNGGTGSNTLIGGSGNYSYYVNTNVTDTITELAEQGIDRVVSYIDYTLGNNIENLTFVGSTALNGTGNALNNLLIGNTAKNTLNGLAGNDTLNGLAGNDALNGGDGNDILTGGDGADILTGGLGKDTYNLAETTHSVDNVVIGENTATTFLSDYLGNTDVVNGFVMGEDRLVVLYTNIVADITTKTTGINSDPTDPDVIFGSIAKHTVGNGIYSFYDINGAPIEIVPGNEKNAYAYMVENTPTNGSIAGFHVTTAPGKTDTIIIQHDHTSKLDASTNVTTLVESHIAIDLVGINVASLDNTWII